MNSRQRLKAIIASAIFPGSGQFIAGEPLKGLVVQVLFVGLLFGVVLFRSDRLPLAVLAPLLVWIYSVFDLLRRDVIQ